MKIEGMDAPSIQLTRAQEQGTSSGEGKTDVKTEIKTQKSLNSVSDNKNLLLLTPYERKELSVSEKVVIDAIEKANKAIMGANKRFEFSIHEKTKQIMVKVIDTDTNEVVREIPPEKTLDMVAKMCEMAGLLVDERR